MLNQKEETSPQKELDSDTATKEKIAPNYRVVLINDEDHTYDYVVELLTKTCKLSRAQAFKCAVEVDLSERTIVFYGSEEECQECSNKINDFGPDHRMPQSRGSMMSEVESL